MDTIKVDDGSLCCAGCGEAYGLHSQSVEVWAREEDADTGLHVEIGSVGLAPYSSTKPNLGGNPSSRRQGIEVHFICENCPAITVLTIAQHKGNEYVTYEVHPTKQFDFE